MDKKIKEKFPFAEPLQAKLNVLKQQALEKEAEFKRGQTLFGVIIVENLQQRSASVKIVKLVKRGGVIYYVVEEVDGAVLNEEFLEDALRRRRLVIIPNVSRETKR